jgi:hypothetical protein
MLDDVSDRSREPAAPPDLSAAGGRAASLEALRRHLLSAPPPFLEGALDNPALSDSEILLLLRNRRATPALLLSIWRDPRWARSHEVKKFLVLHPRLPLATARSLLPHLFWKQLAEVAGSPRVNPVVGRQAERLLLARIEELSLGEKATLARTASRGVIGALLESVEDRVLRGLLGNPMLREMEAERIASNIEAPGEFLSHLAAHHKWGSMRSVQLALLGNPRTPVPAALRLLRKLAPRDLQRLARDDKVPRIVSVGADRRLRAGPRRSNVNLR